MIASNSYVLSRLSTEALTHFLLLQHQLFRRILSFLPAHHLHPLQFTCQSWHRIIIDHLQKQPCRQNTLHLLQQPTKQQQQQQQQPIIQFIVIGNIENRRVSYFQSAVIDFECPAAKCVSWDTVLNWQLQQSHAYNVKQWKQLLQLRSSFRNYEDRPVKYVLRIESTGENFSVEKKLLQLGARDMYERESSGMRIRSENAAQLTFDLGVVRYQRQWYLGFVRSLQLLKSHLEDAVVDMSSSCGELSFRFMNHPDDVMVMFDKRWCYQHLQKFHVPLPRAFLDVESHDALKRVLNEQKMSKVFVKLAHGSSASGVVAYSCLLDHTIQNSMDKGVQYPCTEIATTSAELTRPNAQDPSQFELHNSLSIRRYNRSDDAKNIVDFICSEKAIVEEWLPKAKYANGRNFDLRVVVIAGQAKHFVVRTSHSPMTNLHLGNQRGENKVFLDMIQKKAPGSWEKVKDTCSRVARECFPRSLYMGIDVLISPDFKRHYILEVNAFGDLIPRIYHDNMDTYHSEVKAILDLYSQ